VENFQEQKLTRWKRLPSIVHNNIALNAKLESSIPKINGLKRFTWIKNKVVKEVFKDWKIILTIGD